MKMIGTAQFAKMAGIPMLKAWRIVTSGKFPSHRVGKLWKISMSGAQEWIAASSHATSTITPDAIAKQIGCSGSHIRAQLEKNSFPFATQQPNRRWRITDCTALREWMESETKIFPRPRGARRAGQGATRSSRNPELPRTGNQWKKWIARVGGEAAILSWPRPVLQRFVDEHRHVRDFIHTAEESLKNKP